MYNILQSDGFLYFQADPSDFYNIYSEYAFELYCAPILRDNTIGAYKILYSGTNEYYSFNLSDFDVDTRCSVLLKSYNARTFIKRTGNQGFTGALIQNLENRDPFYFYPDPVSIVQQNASTQTLLANNILNGILLLSNPSNLSGGGFALPTASDLNGFSFLNKNNGVVLDFYIVNTSPFNLSVFSNPLQGNTLLGDPVISGDGELESGAAWYKLTKNINNTYTTLRVS